MEDKLVTLAIHTYQKALIIKTLLKNKGIEVYLHNVNLIQPVVSSGVRVRIKESDLPRALKLIEDTGGIFDEKADEEKDKNTETKNILIPVDFSDYSVRACEIGFNMAAKIGVEVKIVHAYFSPVYPTILTFGETFSYQSGIGDEVSIQIIMEKVKADTEKFESVIKNKVTTKEWPDIKYEILLREGLPEEEIVALSKELKSSLIVMGTRGKSQKDADLIGSVTAEVIEMSKCPVFAIPENTPFSNISEIKRIAFGTSFDSRDLIAVDTLFKMFENQDISFIFFHVSHKQDTWDEIKLAGIKEYFEKQYPNIKVSYDVIDGNDFIFNLEKFVRGNKIDIISLATHKRNIFAKIFNPSMATKMLFHADTPMLVIRQ